jgi:hypothetical protein
LQLCGRVQRVNRRAVRRRLRRRRCPGFRDAGPGEVARLRSRCGARCRWSGSSWRGAHLRVRFEPPSFLRVRAGPVARCRAASAAWLSVAGRANPGWLRAATRSQAPCGENRRGGGKPRGRNETSRVVPAGRRWRQRHWEWTQTSDVGREAHASSESHERKVWKLRATAAETPRAHSGRSKDGTKIMRDRIPREEMP